LREVGVELAYREELLGYVQRDYLIGVIGQCRDCVRWSDRGRNDNASSALRTRDLARGPHGGTGSDAVIDD